MSKNPVPLKAPSPRPGRLLPWAVVFLGQLLFGCGRDLPSAVPLGEGAFASPGLDPLGADAGPRASDRDRTASAASETAKAPAPPAAPPEATTDAENEEDPDTTAREGAEASAAPDGGAVEAGAPGSVLAAAFVGEWQGSDRVIYRFEDLPERVMDDDKARIVVAQRGQAEIELELIDTSDGSTICALGAPIRGDRAVIEAGQSCFSAGPMQATVQSGSARLKGEALLVELVMEVELSADEVLEGEIEYRFEGARK